MLEIEGGVGVEVLEEAEDAVTAEGELEPFFGSHHVNITFIRVVLVDQQAPKAVCFICTWM